MRDGDYLVHRTRTVTYQVLKGLTLVALGGFFIVWSCDYHDLRSGRLDYP